MCRLVICVVVALTAALEARAEDEAISQAEALAAQVERAYDQLQRYQAFAMVVVNVAESEEGVTLQLSGNHVSHDGDRRLTLVRPAEAPNEQMYQLLVTPKHLTFRAAESPIQASEDLPQDLSLKGVAEVFATLRPHPMERYAVFPLDLVLICNPDPAILLPDAVISIPTEAELPLEDRRGLRDAKPMAVPGSEQGEPITFHALKISNEDESVMLLIDPITYLVKTARATVKGDKLGLPPDAMFEVAWVLAGIAQPTAENVELEASSVEIPDSDTTISFDDYRRHMVKQVLESPDSREALQMQLQRVDSVLSDPDSAGPFQREWAKWLKPQLRAVLDQE